MDSRTFYHIFQASRVKCSQVVCRRSCNCKTEDANKTQGNNLLLCLATLLTSEKHKHFAAHVKKINEFPPVFQIWGWKLYYFKAVILKISVLVATASAVYGPGEG